MREVPDQTRWNRGEEEGGVDRAGFERRRGFAGRGWDLLVDFDVEVVEDTLGQRPGAAPNRTEGHPPPTEVIDRFDLIRDRLRDQNVQHLFIQRHHQTDAGVRHRIALYEREIGKATLTVNQFHILDAARG